MPLQKMMIFFYITTNKEEYSREDHDQGKDKNIGIQLFGKEDASSNLKGK